MKVLPVCGAAVILHRFSTHKMLNCVSDFFDAFFGGCFWGGKLEFIEMFAMRKLTVQRQGRENRRVHTS